LSLESLNTAAVFQPVADMSGMDPLAIVALLVSSTVLASAGAGGFLTLILHLMSRNTRREPVPVATPSPSTERSAGAAAAPPATVYTEPEVRAA
jgi:hypothetical protein